MTSEPPVPPAPDTAQPGTGGVATPGNGDPETAAIAITYLQAQLSQATAASDSMKDP